MLKSFRIRFGLCLLISIGIFFPGQQISYSDQWPLYESLRTTASIIFGVLGAWMALIYPKTLSKLENKEVISSEDKKKIVRLLEAMGYSFAILAVVLLLGIVREIIKISPLFEVYRSYLRGISFSILVFLTLIQLWSILLAILPGEWLRDEIHTHEQKNKNREAIFSNSQIQK